MLRSIYTQEFLCKHKILGSEMRTQAFALHSPYEFFSCEQSKAADPKPYKSYGERSRKSMRRVQRKHIYMLALPSRLDFCNAAMRSKWKITCR